MEGVYFVYAEGGDGGGFESIPIIGSLYALGKNISERGKITDIAARLQRDQANTGDFRRYAQEACRQIAEAQKSAFEVYGPLKRSIEALEESIPEDSLVKLKQLHRVRIALYENAYRAFLEAQAKQIANRLSNSPLRSATEIQRTVEINERLYVNAKKLQNTSCDKPTPLLRKLRSDIAYSKLFRLSNISTVIPKIEATLASACRGEK